MAAQTVFEIDKLLSAAERDLNGSVKLGVAQRERLRDLVFEMLGAEPDENSLKLDQ